MKYVIVTGGVVSGLGKGITSSSIGVLLKAAGLIVTCVKIDPYLNVDAGTMSPYEHGEVYVLDDGGEGDLDLGNYERFLDVRLSRDHNITTGKIYAHVIARERRGDYLGKTVQVIPHVTDAVQDWIDRVAHLPVEAHYTGPGSAAANYDDHDEKKGRTPDVCIVEVGGTVGDIESMVFLESLRQLRYRVGADNFCHVHVSLVPVVGAVGEPKSKPTQHGIKVLRSEGLSPDIIICRSEQPIPRGTISKISQFCMVPATHVISVHDVSNIYTVPVLLMEQRVPALVLNCLRINRMAVEELPSWKNLSLKLEDTSLPLVRIALCGKYTGLADSYLSVTKALQHAAIANDVRLHVDYVDSQTLEHTQKMKGDAAIKAYEESWKTIHEVDGILVPGGFGDRGVEGKILAVNYARLHGKPFLGICLGLQVAIIEYARNVLGITDATSGEFSNEAENPVIMFMPEGSTTHMGATMRLGARKTLLKPNSLAAQLYGFQKSIFERHRHRYEVNPEYISRLQAAGRKEDGTLNADAGAGVGLIFSGTDDKLQRMECIELEESVHKFFFGAQYHPEFLSRPLRPSPPFLGFVAAAAGKFSRCKAPPSSAVKIKSGRLTPLPGGNQLNGKASPSISAEPSPRNSLAELNGALSPGSSVDSSSAAISGASYSKLMGLPMSPSPLDDSSQFSIKFGQFENESKQHHSNGKAPTS